MSPIIILSLLLQIACCVHVVRTGRPLYWVFILLVFSYLAVIVYFIAEVLPELRHNPSARRAAPRAASAPASIPNARSAKRIASWGCRTRRKPVADWPRNACAAAISRAPRICSATPSRACTARTRI